MRLIIKITLIGFLLSAGILSAQELNYLYGYPEYTHSNYGTAMIRIDSLNKVNNKLNQLSVPFEGSSAMIVDHIGEIQMFTNGCAVFSKNGLPIENGDGINPGTIHDNMCPNYGYPVPEGVVFIPVPNLPNHFYLVHLGIAEDSLQSYINGPLYYSLIYSDTPANEHKILKKNLVLSSGNIEAFDIVRHANGRDWWMVSSKFLINQYNVFLIDSTGIKPYKSFTLGSDFHESCKKGTGNIKFSNKGDLLVRWNPKAGAKVFDFDRCTGDLSIKKELALEPGGHFGGGGISFTKNDKYVYLNSQLVLYRLNVQDIPNLTKLDTFISAPEFWALSLERSFLGPDGNIYFSQMHSNTTLPFLYNVESELVKPIKMDFKNLVLSSLSARTSPRFINYKLGKIPGSPCDSLVRTTELIALGGLTIYPNPASGPITIELGSNVQVNQASIQVSDAMGKIILTDVFRDSNTCVIQAQSLLSGYYLVSLFLEGKLVSTQKLVVEH